MKLINYLKYNFFILFLLLFTLGLSNNSLALDPSGGDPGMPCADALPFCSDESYNFPNVSDGTVAISGANYGCLGSEPNPVWYYMEVSQPGTIQLGLSQSTGPNGTGSGLDVDFAMWGPFADVASGCAQIMSGNIAPIQCSYSASTTETLGIGASGGSGSGASTPPAAQAGQVYIVLITNYEGQNGYISFNQTNTGSSGAGEMDCSIVDPCEIESFTATPTPCVNDLYNVSGTVTVSSPPETGQLIVEDYNGNQVVVASAPFGTSYNYTLTDLPANGGSCEIEVYFTVGACHETTTITAPTCPQACLINNFEVNIGSCQSGNTFQVNGIVEFTNAPTTGQLVIQDCNGNSATFNAPFTSPQNYTISGINADGASCNITAQFTADSDCISSIDYTNTANCDCSANIGTFTSTGVNPGTNVLCYGDEFQIVANGDYTAPNLANNPPLAEGYDPGIGWLIYSCAPTVGLTPSATEDIIDDPCLLGFMSSADLADMNDLSFVNGFPVGTFSGNTVYFVPITMYHLGEGYYSYVNTDVPCYMLGDVYAVQYLPEITETHTADCQAGTVTATVQGGSPAINGSNFTASNLTPATASFNTTSVGNGGSVVVSGLQDGENYSFDFIDDKGCSITVSGTFQGVSASDFTYDSNDYCLDETNPTPTITGASGGSFTVSPSGLSINPSTGVVNLAASSEGTYTITYTSPGAPCNSTSTFVLNLHDLPTFNITSTAPSCGLSDGQIVLSGLTPNTTYTFGYTQNGTAVGPNSVSSNANGEIQINDIAQGTYSNFTVTNSADCATTNTQNIVLNPENAPVVTAPNDIDICIGESVTLTATNPDDAIIGWSGGVVDGVTFTPSAPGTYTYTVTATIDACTSSDNVVVTVHGLPNINAGTDQAICEGTSTTLTATGGSTYTWDNNVVNGIPFTPTIGSTTYTVTGQSAQGCKNTDQVTILVNSNPEPSFTGENLIGCKPLSVDFTNTTSINGVECLWDFGDGTTGFGCNQVSHTYYQSGVYTVSLTVTDNIGCTGTYTEVNYVEVIPSAIADFSANPMDPSTIAPTVNFTNHSMHADEYEWTFGDESAGSTATNPSHDFPEEAGGSYVVTLVASNGDPRCNDTTSMVITVVEENIFYVPNTFTPDNDDYNEVFKPIFTSGFDPYSYTLEIFNRWGELIFESHNWEVGWNGTYGVGSEQIVKEGVYIWKIKVKENVKDKHNEYVGHVTLLK